MQYGSIFITNIREYCVNLNFDLYLQIFKKKKRYEFSSNVKQVFVKEVHYLLIQLEYCLIYDMKSDDELNQIHNLLYESIERINKIF